MLKFPAHETIMVRRQNLFTQTAGNENLRFSFKNRLLNSIGDNQQTAKQYTNSVNFEVD